MWLLAEISGLSFLRHLPARALSVKVFSSRLQKSAFPRDLNLYLCVPVMTRGLSSFSVALNAFESMVSFGGRWAVTWFWTRQFRLTISTKRAEHASLNSALNLDLSPSIMGCGNTKSIG